MAQVFESVDLLDQEEILKLFRYQAAYNPVYREYLKHLNVDAESIASIFKIPFLPIRFFKSHDIVSCEFVTETVFMSSGTTGQSRSRHLVPSVKDYQLGAQRIFEAAYGLLSDWIVMALLPSYLEQGHSSLVCMADHFIQETQHPLSRFCLSDWEQLVDNLREAEKTGRQVLLIGVSYALLDLAESGLIAGWPKLIVMETGGMKGRRKELIRSELHDALCTGLGVAAVHSEYGMTELFSQAYAKQQGRFQSTSELFALVRDVNDPFSVKAAGRGALNLVDMANRHSCAFIETEDLGVVHADGTFEVLGRMDNSEIRGCSLMYS